MKRIETMKKYIGTKQIEAEPMSMGEAYERGFLQAGRVPSEDEKGNAGYHVKYQDGYESWSPAEPFENAYRCADTFKDRLVIEQKELAEKLEKLCLFTESPKFTEVVTDVKQRELLIAQKEHMGEYLNILNQRIKLLL